MTTPQITRGKYEPFYINDYLKNNPVTNRNMPFTTKAGVELLAWRDIKSLDGKLNFIDRIGTEVALAVLIAAGLVETVVRGFLTLYSLPTHAVRKNGSKFFKDLKCSAIVCFHSLPNGVCSLIANPFCKTAINGFGSLTPTFNCGDRVYNPSLDKIGVEQFRDAFRGKYEEVEVTKTMEIKRTPVAEKKKEVII